MITHNIFGPIVKQKKTIMSKQFCGILTILRHNIPVVLVEQLSKLSNDVWEGEPGCGTVYDLTKNAIRTKQTSEKFLI